MSTNIKCPNCAVEFDVQDVLSADAEFKIKQQYEKQLQQSLNLINADKKKLEEELKIFEEKKKNQNELFQLRLQQEKQKMETELQQEKKKMEIEMQQQLRKTISQDYENQLKLLSQSVEENEEKLKISRQKEMEFLKKEKELITQKAELELSVQRKLQEGREELTLEIRKLEEQKIQGKEVEFQLKLAEYEKKMKDQEKLIDEMKRKAEQVPIQLQGEVQELKLQDLLKSAFPYDVVCEVGKGVKGADCLLTIRNNYGQECGKIIFESKRTQAFGPDWIEKLKADKISVGADLAVLVTKVLPREMERFGEKDGIWVCTMTEAKALVHILRDGVIKIFNAAKKHENKGDKMHLLYNYLTSHEFAEQWKAVREGFMSMKLSIQRERDAMEKLWKSREKQLEKVLLNTAYIKGSIEGIAGQDTIDLNLTDEEEENEEEEIPRLIFK